jgi:hypothetical protein
MVIDNGVSLYSRIDREQFRQLIKENMMEVSVFLICRKKCSA